MERYLARGLMYAVMLAGVSLTFVACNNGGGGSSAVVTPNGCSVAGQVNVGGQYGCVAACPGQPSMGQTPQGCMPAVVSNGCVGQTGYIQTAQGCGVQCNGGGYIGGLINNQCLAPVSQGYNGYANGGYNPGYNGGYTGYNTGFVPQTYSGYSSYVYTSTAAPVYYYPVYPTTYGYGYYGYPYYNPLALLLNRALMN